jgi:hypothetical protein
VIDPTKRALDFADPRGVQNLSFPHGYHLRDRMGPFSLRQAELSIWACISTQRELPQKESDFMGLGLDRGLYINKRLIP